LTLVHPSLVKFAHPSTISYFMPMYQSIRRHVIRNQHRISIGLRPIPEVYHIDPADDVILKRWDW
jgi:hypothetical protein